MSALLLVSVLLLAALLVGGFFLSSGVLLYTLRRFRVRAFGFRSVLRITLVTTIVSILAAAGTVAGGLSQPWVSLVAFSATFGTFFWMLRRRERTSAARAISIYVVSYILSVAVSFVLIVPIVVLVRFFIVSPFEVRGVSMLPTLHEGDLLLVDKLTLRFREPERGDVVVLVAPEPAETKQYYVKRIVGLPGEKIQFKNGKVVIYNAANPQGLTLDESYIPKNFVTEGLTSEPVSIPDGSYYTLGDNRGSSKDSRYWGTLPRWNIVGVIAARIWPPA
jgi:signal peptidase I